MRTRASTALMVSCCAVADPELAELGAHLDQQLAGLLDALGIKTSQGCASRG
jgi:hypothetical protein